MFMKTLIFLISISIGIVMQIICYNKISKINNSRFNARTLYIAKLVFINTLPFLIYMVKSSTIDLISYKTIFIFSVVLIVDAIAFLFGYIIGYKYKLNFNLLRLRLTNNTLNLIYMVIFLCLIATFLVLAYNGVGIKEWLFDTRNAYQYGRRGLGQYYILYQYFSVMLLSISVTKLIMFKKGYFFLLISIIAAYFTGSKSALFSFVIVLIFFYDFSYKRINIKQVFILLLIMLGGFIAFLQIQSQMTLIQYSTYYINFFKLIEGFNHHFPSFFYGKLTMEEIIWNLVPRSIIPSKPLIYGQGEIMASFYGYEIIAKGHFPSFSNYAVPYADFGIFGILLTSFFTGSISGVLENSIKQDFKKNGYTFIMIFCYIILFIFAPINLNIFYLLIMTLLIIIAIKILVKIR